MRGWDDECTCGHYLSGHGDDGCFPECGCSDPGPVAILDTRGCHSGGDVLAAIVRVEESRQTHVEWLDYWHALEAHTCQGRPCPWEAASGEQAALAGDAEHHRRAVEGYDNVLTVLRSVRWEREA